ncbi:MAG: hypothetical protein J0M11_10955 [Anaerolineae bacterium]|nr:hypothetical protein [Anaerolineae bacterium]
MDINTWKDVILKVASLGVDTEETTKLQLVIKEIITLVSEENRKLIDIHLDVKAIKEGAYNSGVIWLMEASKEYRTPIERVEFIEKARDKFIDAFAMEKNDEFRSMLITYQIGICWLLLNKKEDAKFWFLKSYQYCQSSKTVLYKEYEVMSTVDTVKAVITAPIIGTAILTVPFLGKKSRDKFSELFDKLYPLVMSADTKYKFLTYMLNSREETIRWLNSEVSGFDLDIE